MHSKTVSLAREIIGWSSSVLIFVSYAAITVSLFVLVGCSGENYKSPVIEISGRVFDGSLGRLAQVCLDQNKSGKCEVGEPSSTSDPQGFYKLQIPQADNSVIVAEVKASSLAPGNQSTDVIFRLASPSTNYSKEITPYTTLVHLSGEKDFALAEDIVRDALGLPPRIELSSTSTQTEVSTHQKTISAIIAALTESQKNLDWSSSKSFNELISLISTSTGGLPKLIITTKNTLPILSKEVYVEATYLLRHELMTAFEYTVNGRIRGRGNATWGQPKNPYRVQFSNDSLYSGLSDVFGMKKNRNWVLLADYFDRSLMRNKLALTLGSSSIFSDGLKWTPSGVHVEVTLNGDYIGVYLLTEDIRIDSSRLDIKKMSSNSQVNDQDGGYIVEADGRLDCIKNETINMQHVTPVFRTRFCIDTPDETAVTLNQLEFIKNHLNEVESDLASGMISPKINPASFADWYIINELFRNLDSPFLSSVFLWKDSASSTKPQDRLLNLGPLWDFDISAGNINYDKNWESSGCWVGRQHPEIYDGGNWLATLIQTKEFAQIIVSRWQKKRSEIQRFINLSLDTYTTKLRYAQERNFARWPIIGKQLLNHYTWNTWGEEVSFLRTFLNERMAWMDLAISSPESLMAACRQ